MVEHQGPRRHCKCIIKVNSEDVTDRVFPYLISLQVIDDNEGGTDQCHLELDDRNAELQIPPDDAPLEVMLGWDGEGPRVIDTGRTSAAGGQGVIPISAEELRQEAKFGGPGMRQVFMGWVTEVESGFGRRGGGRRMWITAKGYNEKMGAKQVDQSNHGEGKEDDSQESSGQGKVPLKDVMTKVFGAAGLSVAMSPEMEKLARDYWHVNDSPMNFGMRMARETGGIFKIAGSVATLVGQSEGVNADGTPMPAVEAVWGVNLIGWRIKPYMGRPQWGQAQSSFYNIYEGAMKKVKESIGGSTPFGGTSSIANMIHTVADKTTGEHGNKGAKEDSISRRAEGWVLLNGEPMAKAGGFLEIAGARPGVDGRYRMTEVEHNYTRGVGFTTRANVRMATNTGGGFKWKQNDATLTEQFGPPAPQSTDPNAPGYVAPKAGEPGAPSPPISGPQTFSAQELENIRTFNEANPPKAGQPGAPSPPISQ